MQHPREINRREALATLAASTLLGPRLATAQDPNPFRLMTFEADVTPPIGHPLMGGGVPPAKEIVDRLSIRGIVLTSHDRPFVIASIDWCEIRNDAYDAWRSALADAAGTDRERVLFSSIHQHDTPLADLEAERLLEKTNAKGRICDLEFHQKAVQAAVRAVKACGPTAQPISHVGTGTARVEKVASNRRYLDPSGKPVFDRTGASKSDYAREQPEGTIDPLLKALSFWNGDKPVAVLNAYATHPMSYYGKGGITADFVGLARRRRQKAEPSVFQMYISGCSGNVTAGKYNDGSTANREVLASRIEKGMADAWKATKRTPLTQIGFRNIPLRLEMRVSPGFSVDDLDRRLKTGARPFDQCLAALGISRLIRMNGGSGTIDVPALDFGVANYLLLPGESYVEYQLLAQTLRPDAMVMVAGYGECSPGYIPTETAFNENDTNLRDWCWVAPGSEARMVDAIRKALG